MSLFGATPVMRGALPGTTALKRLLRNHTFETIPLKPEFKQ